MWELVIALAVVVAYAAAALAIFELFGVFIAWLLTRSEK